MEITTIQVSQETRKKLQERKLEWDKKNVDEVITQALNLSGSLSMGEADKGSSAIIPIVKVKKTKGDKK